MALNENLGLFQKELKMIMEQVEKDTVEKCAKIADHYSQEAGEKIRQLLHQN